LISSSQARFSSFPEDGSFATTDRAARKKVRASFRIVGQNSFVGGAIRKVNGGQRAKKKKMN
jgi:hypothetical protein